MKNTCDNRSIIRERVRRGGNTAPTIQRVVQGKRPIHRITVGHYYAFHERRYCMYVPGADAWFEINRLDPLTEDYLEGLFQESEECQD